MFVVVVVVVVVIGTVVVVIIILSGDWNFGTGVVVFIVSLDLLVGYVGSVVAVLRELFIVLIYLLGVSVDTVVVMSQEEFPYIHVNLLLSYHGNYLLYQLMYYV